MKRHVARLTLITLFAVSLIVTAWLADVSANSQQPDRIVVNKPWPVEPVKIVGVKTKRRADLELGKAFDDDDDWLDGLSLTVLNNSDKTVTAMTVSVIFSREPGDTRHPLALDLHFGPGAITPEYKDRDPNKIIKVHHTGELSLTPRDYLILKQDFEQLGYQTVKRVELVVREVGFEDGSMLYSGTFYSQDPAYPNDPTKKLKAREQPAARN